MLRFVPRLMSHKTSRTFGALLSLLLVVGPGAKPLYAARPCQCEQCPAATWHAVETDNLRVLNHGPHPVAREVAESCEIVREQLARKWLAGSVRPNHWNPKCDIVLHPTEDGYLREVGQGARNTVASSLIDRKQGNISLRRIDVRATQSNWQTSALGHELTHVVLADRFPAQPLPRWIDEGAAILADSIEKQRLHRKDLQGAVAGRTEFRVLELITLANYPDAQQWGTFYGQSASLVQFLVSEAGEKRFIEFVEASLEHGYETALVQVYCFGIPELERRWYSQLRQPSPAGTSIHSGRKPADALPRSQRSSTQPISLAR